MLRTTDFCGKQITRLILGDNPFNGHSYIRHVHSSGEMLDFYTADKVLNALFEADGLGINAYMALADPFILRILRQYKNEGGKMEIIFQSYSAIELSTNMWQMMMCEPYGIYLAGSALDYLREEENIEEIHKRLKLIRDAGVKTGFASHEPETILRAEREGWDVDFYSTCLYNARRTQRGEQSGFITGKHKDLAFYPGDPPFMFEAIRAVSKP